MKDHRRPSHPPARWKFYAEARTTGSDADTWKTTEEFTEEIISFHQAEFLRLNPARLHTSPLQLASRMKEDGSGLAAAIASITLGQPETFKKIVLQMKSVIPNLEQIRTIVVPRKLTTGREPTTKDDPDAIITFETLFDFEGAVGIPAYLVSEGTLLVLGLLTALMGRDRPDLILLDDLDRGLHPRAQREVVGLLRGILDQNPELQIVATTHSPYLVDCLRPEEVRLTTLGDDGTVSCGSLVEHPEFEKWKDEMLPGEMWSLFGEKWVADLNKAPGAN